MASFCGNCGSPLVGNGAFCPRCGAAAGGTQSPAAASTTPDALAPAAPAAGGSSALKIVVVIFCCLALGGAAVIGGVIYLAHRVKQAVVQKAAENGVDLHSLGSRSTQTGAAGRPLAKACEFLTKEEVSRLIGEPIERAENRDAMCLYYGPPGLNAKLANEKVTGTFKRTQTPGANVDNMDVATAVDQMANSLGAQAGQTGSGGDLPLLMLGVVPDGKAQMTAVAATTALFGGIGRAAGDAKGTGFGANISDLGDKAIRIPKLGLNVLQGEVLIRVIPGPFPDADAKSIAVARAVLPKI